jgi:predicted O-methyltransferase YrrM
MSGAVQTLVTDNARQIARAAMDGILGHARRIPGLVEVDELVLLVLAVIEAARLPAARLIVEIGSYLGRSTCALALAVRMTGAGHIKVIAIDPHKGRMRDTDADGVDTFDAFMQNMRTAEVAGLVTPVRRRSDEVTIEGGVGLLFIDALHDYASVEHDLTRHYGAVAPGGLIAFHDYSIHHPGVVRCVDEAVTAKRIAPVGRAGSLYLARKAQAAPA